MSVESQRMWNESLRKVSGWLVGKAAERENVKSAEVRNLSGSYPQTVQARFAVAGLSLDE